MKQPQLKKATGVYARKDSPYWWICYTEKGRRRYVSSGSTDYSEACIIRKRILTRLKSGIPLPPNFTRHLPLEATLIGAIRHRVTIGEIKEASAKIDLMRLKRFVDFCATANVTTIDAVTSELVTEFGHFLRNGGSHGRTVDRYFDTIKKAVPHELQLKRSGIKKGIGKEIPAAVLKAILSEFDPVMRSYFLLLAETGLRPPQLAKVQAHWIQRENIGGQPTWYINFPPDSYIDSKRAPLTILNEVAMKVIDSLPCKKKFLFDDGAGQPLIRKNIYYRRWRRVVERLGYPEYRPYDIRHTFSIREAIRTGDFIYVAACLGNDPQTTVAYYSNLTTVQLVQRARGKSITGSMAEEIAAEQNDLTTLRHKNANKTNKTNMK